MFQDYFQEFDIWDAIESGLYYVIIGYYFLIFAYFLFMRYRTSRKLYWLYFSLLFLGLAASRVFFIAYYFYTPELINISTISEAELVDQLMLLYRLATFSTWVGIACLMGVLGVLIFPPITEETTAIEGEGFKIKLKNWFINENTRLILKIVLIVIPLLIGILTLILPDSLLMDPDFVDRYPTVVDESSLITIFGYPAGRAVLNFILLPLFVAIIPFLFIDLARRTYGVLRKSYALNAIGFFLYFSGRILQGVFDSLEWSHIRATVPPLLILLSLLIIVIANNYEQLR
ncbi:MAG: hypothetical protein ACFFA6_10220 [Promethearchaeota archaeon]